MRIALFHLKKIKSTTKLVKLKVSFGSDKWLDEPGVGFKVFILKSPVKSKLSHLFKVC